MFGARSVVIAVSNNKTERKLTCICIQEKSFIFSVQVQMLLTGSRIILTLRYKTDSEYFVRMRACFKLIFYKPIGSI